MRGILVHVCLCVDRGLLVFNSFNSHELLTHPKKPDSYFDRSRTLKGASVICV